MTFQAASRTVIQDSPPGSAGNLLADVATNDELLDALLGASIAGTQLEFCQRWIGKRAQAAAHLLPGKRLVINVDATQHLGDIIAPDVRGKACIGLHHIEAGLSGSVAGRLLC